MLKTLLLSKKGENRADFLRYFVLFLALFYGCLLAQSAPTLDSG